MGDSHNHAAPGSQSLVRVLVKLVCEEPKGNVDHVQLQTDMELPHLVTGMRLTLFDNVYPCEQIDFVLEKSRYQLTLSTTAFPTWKMFIKRVDELMHAGFKIKIYPSVYSSEDQAKSAIFQNDLEGNRLTAMRINGQWHTLREDERFWVKFNPDAVIFVPTKPEEAQNPDAATSDVHHRYSHSS